MAPRDAQTIRGKLANWFKSGRDKAKSHEKALEILSEFSRQTTAVRVEIENTPYYFYSPVAVRGGAVVMEIPVSLQDHLADGGWVRSQAPNSPREELRLQVRNQEHLEMGDMAKIFCRIPSALVEPKRRASSRYYTGKFKDLMLQLPDLTFYPVLDLSSQGLRIQTGEMKYGFTAGEPLKTKGWIRMGKKANIDLERLTPRFVAPDTTGRGFEMAGDRLPRKILNIFLESLDAETQRLCRIPQPT